MNNVIDFLVKNYIYVAAGSLVLIIILIGIIVAGSKKNKKKGNPDMVSMSDVKTGSINDVAMNLNMKNGENVQGNMKPLNVAELPQTNNTKISEDIPKELFTPIENVQSAPLPVEMPSPIIEEKPSVENAFTQSFNTSPITEETPVMEPVINNEQVNPIPVMEAPVNKDEVEILDMEETSNAIPSVDSSFTPENNAVNSTSTVSDENNY